MGIEKESNSKIEFTSLHNKSASLENYGFISRGMETISVTTPIEYEDGFANNFLEAFKKGYYPVIVANHTSHADAIILAKLTFILTSVANEALPKTEYLNGFMLPLSKSLDDGKQGFLRQEFYKKARPMLAKYDLYPVLTATKNDVEKRGLEKNSHNYSSELITGIKNNYGIAVLAEGTVMGGKRNENGTLFGMQPLADDSMAHIVVNTKRYRKAPVMFIPVGIDGGYKVFDPTRGLPSFDALKTGLGLGKITEIAKMKVGMPMKSDNEALDDIIKNKNWKELDTTIGKNIARLIPEELRGVYSV